MDRRRLLLGAACAWGGFVVAARAAKKEVSLSDIQIAKLKTSVVDDAAEFEVIDSRMDETATAAVLFGIIGAAVNSAQNNSEDDAKAATYLETAAALNIQGLISDALTERLTARGTVPIAGAAEEASHTLLVEIGEWGLLRKDKATPLMRCFLKLNLSVLDSRNERVWGPERLHAVGSKAASLENFPPEDFRVDMETLAVRTGQQVASRIIYR